MPQAPHDIRSGPPNFHRRLLLAVMWLNVLAYVAAAVALVVTFDPNRLYFVRHKYQTGHHRLLAHVCICTFAVVITAVFLVRFHRSDSRSIAAGYATLNGLVVQYPLFGTIGPYVSGEETSVAAGAFWGGWLLLTAVVAGTYWLRKRRFDAGGRPTRPAFLVIAEALNSRVR